MALKVRPEGFTVLQDSTDAELDIVFVHGLQGHPRNTWTYQTEETQATESKAESKPGFIGRWLGKKAPDANGGLPSSSQLDLTNGGVFWPQDLLGQLEACNKARIITYGYDSAVLGLSEATNFTTIAAQGESLLNGLARMREHDMHRPLMFVTHSLGGLIVKAALNQSLFKLTEVTKDLRAIVNSTFAIIFFGTPHRGSAYGNFGTRVARVVSALGHRPYNDRIVKNLVQNSEILTELRKSFDITLEHMIEQNDFESSTFQETKGLSGVVGFQGKVVDDYSSELGRNDRNDHIDRDHRDMCRFSSADDLEYKKVANEIERHINRQKQRIDKEGSRFLERLRILGGFAGKHLQSIKAKTEGTLEWLYTAPASKHEDGIEPREESSSLSTWLASGEGLFWVTGRPGSGKSTAMKSIFESSKTIEHVENNAAQRRESEDPTIAPGSGSNANLANGRDEILQRATNCGAWCRIGLFITNHEAQEQRRWIPMLHGLLLQLLNGRPELIRNLMAWSRSNLDYEGESAEKSPVLSQEQIEASLIYCLTQQQSPFKVLLVLDGLNELEDEEEVRLAMRSLRRLTKTSATFSNTLRVCVASRPEQICRDEFWDAWRINIHDHTSDDIHTHVWSLLRQNPRFRYTPEEEAAAQLGQVLDYIKDNAQGVFLWAHSVASRMNSHLFYGEPVRDLIRLADDLPPEMHNIYGDIIFGIAPTLRRRAYIMLEVVLRARQPPTLLELSLITWAAEAEIARQANSSSTSPTPYIPELEDSLRLQRQLITACKCMLAITPQISSSPQDPNPEPLTAVDSMGGVVGQATADDSISDDFEMVNGDQRDDDGGPSPLHPNQYVVHLVHKSAREFLLKGNYLGFLFTPDQPGKKPRENGHSYILSFAREWLRLSSQSPIRQHCSFDPILEVPFHAVLLERTLSSDVAAEFFPLLDDLDRELTLQSEELGGCWPAAWYQRQFSRSIRNWHPTFAAVAVGMNMTGYVTYLIGKAEKDGDRSYFLNEKEGRSLLHFAVYFASEPPNLEMVELLLYQGANIKAEFEGKTAVESLVLNKERPTGEPDLGIIELLVRAGADPNSWHCPSGRVRSGWYPLIHITARAPWIIITRRIAFMKLLHKNDANINAKDSDGNSFPEVLYWTANTTLSSEEWKWLFRHGAKITKKIISKAFLTAKIRDLHTSSTGSASTLSGICDGNDTGNGNGAALILRSRDLRKREWYEKDAAAAAERLRPGWFD